MTGGLGLEDLLGAEDQATLRALASVEVLVGIRTLNHARSLGTVLDSASTALAASFPARKVAVVVADDGSQDRTLDAARAWQGAAPGIGSACVRAGGLPRRGQATLVVLAAARELGARACALVDGDLIGLDPRGVAALLDPVLRGDALCVFPAYTRTVADGTLTSNLLAPMAGALYGRCGQQVLGGCAGVSRQLIDRVLGSPIAARARSTEAVSLHLTVEALVADLPVMETHLGVKRSEPGSAPPDLAGTVVRVVGSFFELMDDLGGAWQTPRTTTPVSQRGGPVPLLPVGEGTHPERMVRAFRMGLKDLLPVWEQIMREETLERLYPLGLLGPDEFRFPPADWARVVCDFAVAHHERRVPRDHLLRALTPLYLGRVAAFLYEARGVMAARLPELLDALGCAFVAERESLIARWR